MEVLNEEAAKIPGMYSIGNSAGGWVGDSYCIQLSGYAFGFAVYSGRVAGENAAKYAKGIKSKLN